MKMPIYDGNEWEVRMAATQEGLATATKIPFMTTWTYDRDPGIEQVGKGMGMGRGKEVHETLTEITGSLEKTYDDSNIIGSSPFGVLATMEDVDWWLEFKNSITGKKIQFGGVHGHYTHDHAEDDFGTETWDWAAESMEVA